MKGAVARDDLRGIRGEYQRASVTYPALHSPPHALSRRSFKRKIARDPEARPRASVRSIFSSRVFTLRVLHTYVHTRATTPLQSRHNSMQTARGRNALKYKAALENGRKYARANSINADNYFGKQLGNDLPACRNNAHILL